MNAKEMFEALGYTYYDHHFLNVPNSQDVMIPQDEPYLEYRSEDKNIGEEIIIFHGGSKFVSVRAIGNIGEKRCSFPAPLNVAEIKAIEQQMKELGWWKEG